MKTILAILIFCIVLFMYLHIYFHLKTSNDLEVYEIEQPSKENFEEICDLRQPVILNYHIDELINNCNKDVVTQQYGAFDIKIRNVKEYDNNSEMYLPLTLNTASDIFRKDEQNRYLSNNNSEFLEETGLIKHYQLHDLFLRPSTVSNCIYDIIFSSKNTCTPLAYEINYRNFYLVTKGSITIKLIPPKSSRYLYNINDYDNFEFISPIDPWNVQDQFKNDFNKIKTLEVTLTKGQIIFIPAYWWHSIKFTENSSVSSFKYRTYMNNLAISNHLILHMLQNQNVKREIVQKKNLNIDHSIENKENPIEKTNGNKEDE